MEKIEVDHIMKDYIKIEYDGPSNLYILATQLEMLQKYSSGETRAPKLNKLEGLERKKTKTRVRGAVKNIAKELVELYAARQNETGFQYGPDTVWQKEFEEMFPFEETEDQLLAIEAAKKDMESGKIMDRLICGDVGYGKTEELDMTELVNDKYEKCKYVKGEMVYPDFFDEDRWNECSHGINFFVNKQDAINYNC